MVTELNRLDLAAMLEVTPQSVWNWKKRGYITARREGVWTYFNVREVLAAHRKRPFAMRIKPDVVKAVETYLKITEHAA
jgi:hypothetical protein